MANVAVMFWLLQLVLVRAQWCKDYDFNMCRDEGEYCNAGYHSGGCWCERGYWAQQVAESDVRVQEWREKEEKEVGSTLVTYTCCPKSLSTGPTDDGVYCGEYKAPNFFVGASLLVASIVTICCTSVMIHCWPGAKSQLSPEALTLVNILQGDLAAQLAPAPDGAQLHQTVAPDSWCLTKEQLKELLLITEYALDQGLLTPTDKDPFDPNDRRDGPCIHTLVHQLIKPITAARGNASWALMKNPQGLKCDLFVTHGWAEGAFTLLRRTLDSWPSKCNAAYICCFSNPQNLDIGGMITTPAASPFAAALESAMVMLVVPNRVSSIYTRIWCIYEAFMAYATDKVVILAHDTTLRLWLYLLRQSACFTAGISLVGLLGTHWQRSFVAQQIMYFVTVGLGILVYFLASFSLQYQKFTISVILSMTLALTVGGFAHANWALYKSFTPLLGASMYVMIVCFEAERLSYISSQQLTTEVRRGFTGRLREAESSVRADYDTIMEEIREANIAPEVEESLQVLVNQGLSTRELRATVKLCGILGNAHALKIGLSSIGLLFWFGASGLYLSIYNHFLFRALHSLIFLQALTWLCLVSQQQRDRQVFATLLHKLWLWIYVPFLSVATFLSMFGILRRPIHDSPSALFAISVGRFATGSGVVVLTAAGPLRTAQLPVLGPPLVRALFAEGLFSRARNAVFRRISRSSQEGASGGELAAQTIGQTNVHLEADRTRAAASSSEQVDPDSDLEVLQTDSFIMSL